jgi:hypothetical protein
MTDWITAIGTLIMALIAFVAIFQDKIRSWLTRPRLEISINLAPPDCIKTKMLYSIEYRGGVSLLPTDPREWPREREIDTYYFRLKVTNIGNEKAELVEVFASELSKQQADGSFKIVDSFLPMNLVWSHFHTMLFPSISPTTYKHCDFAHILRPERREEIPGEHKTWPNVLAAKTILSLDTIVKPTTLSNLLPNGAYRMVIIVAAANAKAVRKTLEFTITGDWYDDEQQMLGQGIGIRLID